LAYEDENYQLRAHLFHQGRTEVTILSASPKALLAKLPLAHGQEEILSQTEQPVPELGVPGTQAVIQVTPEGGSPYQIKRWTLPQLSLGPARLEFPKGLVRLVGYGNKDQPSFPISTTTPPPSKKPAPPSSGAK
jgi:hypothetical protein